MMNRKITVRRLSCVLLAVSVCACGQAAYASGAGDEAQTEQEALSGQVASGAEILEPDEVTDEGMVPVYPDELNDGTYEISVRSSSEMFDITSCLLTVDDGEMTARMTMGGTGYLYVWMGTGEEAAAAEKAACIPYEEQEDGTHCFTVPVEALDAPVDCAAYSRRKEKWYERQLCFLAGSLPDEAFREQRGVTAQSLGLEDGTYTAQVSVEGGSGRASVATPAQLEVKDGEVTAVIEWSSPKYDYMIVSEEKYLPVNTEGNSVFEIPVAGFDRKLSVRADTTAMSKPYEIEYSLTFDAETIEKKN